MTEELRHYPHPSRPGVTAIMRGNRKTDTRPEVALRSSLHRAGLRFRKDYSLRIDEDRPIRVDIAFPTAKVVVFVDGCFWHRCPEHGTEPRSNTHYWGPKLDLNATRDRKTDRRLQRAGWRVVRIWEHEEVNDAAARVLTTLERQPRRRLGPSAIDR